MQSVIDHSRHSAFSDPGRYGGLLTGLATDPAALSVVARNVIAHYRASGDVLPAKTRHEIDSRWLEVILAADQSRHPWPLSHDRPLPQRVQGCCRDHTLFCVGVLRSHGIPARSRVGFAGYFVEGWHHDHVIVEAWLDGRWRRFDAELDGPCPAVPDPTDIGPSRTDQLGFVTAAQVWAGHRRHELAPATYGVDPAIPALHGERFVFDEVIHEVAHRFGDELLLWDSWGRMAQPGDGLSEEAADWLDAIVALLLAADGGDLDAERELLRRYRSDEGLHPGSAVLQLSPFGDPAVRVRLDTRLKP